MKVPRTFVSKKDQKNNTKRLLKGIIRKPPNNLQALEEYLQDVQVPVYGYDRKKRIHKEQMSLKIAIKNKLNFGIVDLISPKFFRYKHLYMTQGSFKPQFSIKFEPKNFEKNIIKEIVTQTKETLSQLKKERWRLAELLSPISFPTMVLNNLDYEESKIDLPKELQWVFETFKKYNYEIYMYGDTSLRAYKNQQTEPEINIILNINKPTFFFRIYRNIKKNVDTIKKSERNKKIIIAKKNGYTYVFNQTFPHPKTYFFSDLISITEKSGKNIVRIHKLAKNDLEHNQFRVVPDYDSDFGYDHQSKPLFLKKFKYFKEKGFTFLPENPYNLEEKLTF